jgi:hypothetical protein
MNTKNSCSSKLKSRDGALISRGSVHVSHNICSRPCPDYLKQALLPCGVGLGRWSKPGNAPLAVASDACRDRKIVTTCYCWSHSRQKQIVRARDRTVVHRDNDRVGCDCRGRGMVPNRPGVVAIKGRGPLAVGYVGCTHAATPMRPMCFASGPRVLGRDGRARSVILVRHESCAPLDPQDDFRNPASPPLTG